MLHRSAPLGDIHTLHNWEYANAAARVAAIGLLISDRKKLALQLDNNSLWLLTNNAPTTWVQVGGTGDMQTLIYDPAGKLTNAFNIANQGGDLDLGTF